MIRVEFFGADPCFGFSLSGHAAFADAGNDIVCAAVSSAAYMTANTITDVLHQDPVLSVSEGTMLLKLKTDDEADCCRAILSGFLLHITALLEQYPENIKLTISEV